MHDDLGCPSCNELIATTTTTENKYANKILLIRTNASIEPFYTGRIVTEDDDNVYFNGFVCHVDDAFIPKRGGNYNTGDNLSQTLEKCGRTFEIKKLHVVSIETLLDETQMEK